MTDHHKFQFIMKKAFNLVSTFKNTPWYNETNSSSKKNINIEDINIQESPSVPIWEKDISDNYTDLSFGSGDISGIHTISSGNYNSNEYMSSGVHLDSTATVALFVRLKLDKMNDYDICDNAYAYTVYPTTESNNLLLENAYEFNYNSQINVNATIPINVNATIPVFKPYNYTLEYSSDGTTFNRLANSDGNWIFDNKTGIITFEENPTATVDLNSTDLYFTFVKYLGAQGLQNLLYYKNGKVGINVSDPQSELDVSGSVSITGDLDICGNLDVDTDVLCIDSTSQRVGINTSTPTTTLDVSGSAYIDGNLSINYGIGAGFYPIGAIIMWPTNDPNTGLNTHGTWLLCDGSTISSTIYPDLYTILGGGAETEVTTLPDFTDKYIKMADSVNVSSTINSGNSDTSYVLLSSNIPQHSHSSDAHNHSVVDISHSHSVPDHNHTITDGGHTHSPDKQHTHGISDSGHTHSESNSSGHRHTVTQQNHSHNYNNNHTHGTNIKNHTHDYYYGNANVNNQDRGDKSTTRITDLTINNAGTEVTSTDAATGNFTTVTSQSTNTMVFGTDATACNDSEAVTIDAFNNMTVNNSSNIPQLTFESPIQSGGNTNGTNSFNITVSNASWTTDINQTATEITAITTGINDYTNTNSEQSDMHVGVTEYSDTYTPSAITINTTPTYGIAFYFIRAE